MICACQIKATHITDMTTIQTARTKPFCDSEAAEVNFSLDHTIVMGLPVLFINARDNGIYSSAVCSLSEWQFACQGKERLGRGVSPQEQRDWTPRFSPPDFPG